MTFFDSFLAGLEIMWLIFKIGCPSRKSLISSGSLSATREGQIVFPSTGPEFGLKTIDHHRVFPLILKKILFVVD
jgi:hypothetical protein